MAPKRTPQTRDPRLIILSAPSGAGKSTLCQLLLSEHANYRLSVSTTTRSPRPNEKDGEHYFFVTKEEFIRRREHGDFAEWAEVHGNLYGTSKSMIETFLKQGHPVLFDIDVQGAMSLQQIYHDQALLIFIHPPSIEILEQRLRDRKGDSPATIEKRIREAYNELKWSQKFDYQIVNDELKRAYQELKSILQKECR